MPRVLRILLACAVGGAIALAGAAPAQAATAETVDVQAKLARDGGLLTVSETFTLSAAAAVGTITQQLPTSMDRGGTRYSYDITDIAVTADGVGRTPAVTKKSGVLEVSFEVGTATEFVLTYSVSGATIKAVGDRIDFTWQVVAPLNIDVAQVTGTVALPAGALNNDCSAGTPGGLLTCSTYTAGLHGDTNLSFTQTALTAGQIVQAEIVFMSGAVDVTEQPSPIWSLGRALTPGGAQIGLMAAVIVVGGLLMFGVWRRQRTAGYRGVPTTVAQFVKDEDGKVTFEPDPAARPGMIGTLVDSSVDPADIVATILDLAVRGHVRITELPTSQYAVNDWTFSRLTTADELRPYEHELLDILTTSETKVSDLTTTVPDAIATVQQHLYREVLDAGWFSRLPFQRSKWVLWGWIGVGVAALLSIALVIWTTFTLVGLGLLAVALVALALTYQAHHVTPEGAAVYAGLQVLASDLRTHAGTDFEADDRYTEISKILPYAVVLGSWDAWLDAMVAADQDEAPDPEALSWYHAPEDWHMQQLPTSLDAFITVVTGRLFARA